MKKANKIKCYRDINAGRVYVQNAETKEIAEAAAKVYKAKHLPEWVDMIYGGKVEITGGSHYYFHID